MDDPAEPWTAVARRNARCVQTTIGWIFWDPGAVARTEALGLPGPVGYIAARCAPLAAAGPNAVIAAFGSISPMAIRLTFDLVSARTSFEACWRARDEAVVEGLRRWAPSAERPLVELGPALWSAAEQLPLSGRVLFAAHLEVPRPAEPLLSAWHAVNCLREWRGDTHWAIVAAHGLTGQEASVLHNEWLGYEPDWLPRSRGSNDEQLDAAWAALIDRGLATVDARGQRCATPAGIELRQAIEDETDRQCGAIWSRLGPAISARFADELEPPCELLLARVDQTAGPNYQPASRLRG